MNIIIWLIVIIGCTSGALSTLYILVSGVGMLGYKIYRKCRYHASFYD